MDYKKLTDTESHKKQRDLVFKFLVIGDYGVGKTAVVRRYTEGKFSSNYKITIGADFSLKTIMWDKNTRISLQLWDIAGHERFSYMTRVYYKYAIGCAIVFDVSRYATFQSVKRWLSDLRERVVYDDGKQIPVILLANKWDMEETCVSNEAVGKLCKECGITWFKTSAKENINIDEAMKYLIEEAVKISIIEDKPGFSLTDKEESPKKKSSCCNT